MQPDDFQTSDDERLQGYDQGLHAGSSSIFPMSDERKMTFIAGIVASTLYQLAVFIASVLSSNTLAEVLILITMGLCYVAAFAQLGMQMDKPASQNVAFVIVLATIFFGACAGIVQVAGLLG